LALDSGSKKEGFIEVNIPTNTMKIQKNPLSDTSIYGIQNIRQRLIVLGGGKNDLRLKGVIPHSCHIFRVRNNISL